MQTTNPTRAQSFLMINGVPLGESPDETWLLDQIWNGAFSLKFPAKPDWHLPPHFASRDAVKLSGKRSRRGLVPRFRYFFNHVLRGGSGSLETREW